MSTVLYIEACQHPEPLDVLPQDYANLYFATKMAKMQPKMTKEDSLPHFQGVIESQYNYIAKSRPNLVLSGFAELLDNHDLAKALPVANRLLFEYLAKSIKGGSAEYLTHEVDQNDGSALWTLLESFFRTII